MYYAEATHSAIIDIETFQEAKKIMSQNSEKYSGGNTRANMGKFCKILYV